MNEDFLHEVGNYFTKEEWGAWARGEVNIFDLFVERTGMTQEEADRLRNGRILKKPLTFPKDCRNLKAYEKNNT